MAASLQSRRHELGVYARVDLHEVRRQELQREAERFEFVAQGPDLGERRDRAGATGLQVDVDAVARAEVAERLRIGGARRCKHAQHERGHAVGHDRFDLRQSFANAGAGDQVGQLAEQVRRAAARAPGNAACR